jgi:hypothetical protein
MNHEDRIWRRVRRTALPPNIEGYRGAAHTPLNL